VHIQGAVFFTVCDRHTEIECYVETLEKGVPCR